MKICVLQADYGNSKVDYQNYDPKRNLSELIPDAYFKHVFLNKLNTFRQIKQLSKENFDIYVNLCEGYLEWDIPSIDVIHTLELLGLPFTGPNSKLYDPPKDIMKYVSYCCGIKTPNYVKASNIEEALTCIGKFSFPMFVKPLKAGDSLGIDNDSKCMDKDSLLKKLQSIFTEFDEILIEECIEGREFTVLVAADPKKDKECISFTPVEYIFPEGYSFKTYSLKTNDLHPESNKPINDLELELGLRDAAERIFKAFNGVGYARLDFRVNEKREIYFLEINFTCSLFYDKGYEGSADYILEFDGIGKSGFLKLIIAEGIRRHNDSKKMFEIKGDSISGFGIYAIQDIKKGQAIFMGEERSQRFVTKRHVKKYWNPEDKRYFAQYAYPVGDQVYCLWDNDPTQWAPQNHSCSPNTLYDGLNVVAIRKIQKGEELTLDYSSFLDETAETFQCHCNSPECRKIIRGIKGNSINQREKEIVIKAKSKKTTSINF